MPQRPLMHWHADRKVGARAGTPVGERTRRCPAFASPAARPDGGSRAGHGSRPSTLREASGGAQAAIRVGPPSPGDEPARSAIRRPDLGRTFRERHRRDGAAVLVVDGHDPVRPFAVAWEAAHQARCGEARTRLDLVVRDAPPARIEDHVPPVGAMKVVDRHRSPPRTSAARAFAQRLHALGGSLQSVTPTTHPPFSPISPHSTGAGRGSASI